MKTLKISDDAHAKLTSVVGRLMAESGKTKTYSDAIEALLSTSITLSPELLANVDKLIRDNPQLGYIAREELIQEAIRRELTRLHDKENIGRKGRSSGKK